MGEAYPKKLFLTSLKRCEANPGFLASFYERFMKSSDEVARYFRFTNFEKQHKMLMKSLELSARATEGDREGLREIAMRAETHSRPYLNVRPPLYQLWLDSLIAAASEFDPEWDDETEQAWRRILGFIIKHMVSHYDG